MLELRNISAGYGKKTVIQHISANIPSGKITALIGPNGCGKSTLLKAVCGIIPAGGDAVLDGIPLFKLPQKQLAQHVAYLPQNRPVPDITVQKLVLHGRFPYLGYPRRYRQEDLNAANSAIAQLGISELADVKLANLSGGQRQKVYIAMALAQDTDVVLLDEPTAFLDAASQLLMLHHAQMLCKNGKTVLIVLHDITQAMQFADSLLVMSHGEVAAVGNPQKIFSSGILNSVFDITVKRVLSDGIWRYYYEEGKTL